MWWPARCRRTHMKHDGIMARVEILVGGRPTPTRSARVPRRVYLGTHCPHMGQKGDRMLKRAFLVSTLVALAVSGSTAVSLAASRHGGGFGFGAAPESVIPASADLYVGLNLGGAQGAALSQLWAAYQTHPGTAAALAHLRAAIGRTSLLQTSRLLSSLGARAGVAIWAPGTTGPAVQPGATGPAVQPGATGPAVQLHATGPAVQLH